MLSRGTARPAARVLVFAKNQILAAIDPGQYEFHTDPVPLSGADRATVQLYVSYLIPASISGDFNSYAEVSNDGVNWADSGLGIGASAPFPPGSAIATGAVHGEFIRFRCRFVVTGAGVGAVCFDLHVLLDKS